MGSLVQGASEQRTALVHKTVREVSQRIFLQLARLPQTIVVSARGYVVGADFQFVAVAGLVIASETARFAIPQVRLAHTTDPERFHTEADQYAGFADSSPGYRNFLFYDPSRRRRGPTILHHSVIVRHILYLT